MPEKKGVSSVVATMLLVAITIVAVGMVIVFVKPLIEDNLARGKSCFEFREYFKVLDSEEYTCYESNNTKLMIERKNEEAEVRGFIVSLIAKGESKVYEVTSENPNNAKMLNTTGGYQAGIIIQEPGEARTYLFDKGNATTARIAVIQEDNSKCDSEPYIIPAC